MKIATLGRKPIGETNVARNLLAHGAGAINIDASRVPRREDYYEKCVSVVGCGSNVHGNVYSSWAGLRENSWNKLGAWPANFLLKHTPSCVLREEGWACAPSCVCVALGDKSRYFMQCAGDAEICSYLMGLLSPPGESVLVVPEDPTWDPPPNCPGLVVPWPATEAMFVRWLPLLRPGAHLVILSDDGIDVGCALDVAGYEIRDAILIGEEAQGIHYCPKTSARERNAGVPLHSNKVAVVRFFPSDEIDTECPAEGFPEEEVPPDLAEFFHPREIMIQRRHGNHHATVKPQGIMRKILREFPEGSLIVDPFLGSGSTAIAALNLHLSCIGIEKDTEEGYIRIALARVDYWCPIQAVVRSEWKPGEPEEIVLWR